MKFFATFSVVAAIVTSTASAPAAPGSLYTFCGPSASCNPGLYCAVTNTKTKSGTCKQGLKINDKCGGGRPTSTPCGNGLVCLYKPKNKPGQQGTCQIPVSKKGEKCGGGFLYAPYCDKDLFCQVKRNTVGASGTCIDMGKEGSSCGAFTMVPQAPCGTNLTCVLTDPQIPDAGGVCSRTIGKEGDGCGAFIFPPQPPCDTGLVCKLTNPQIPDAGGKCARKVGKVGDACGAFIFPPQPSCDTGLRCKLTNPKLPDAGGKCTRQ